MKHCIEVDDHIIIPAPWGQVIADSRKVNGEMKNGNFLANWADKPMIEKMVGAGLIPKIINPGDAYKYACSIKPWINQRIAVNFMVAYKSGYNLSGLGAGKSNSTWWGFDALKQLGLVTHMLIIAPLSILAPAWMRDRRVSVPHIKAEVLAGTKQSRIKKIVHSGADVFVINHDGPKVVEAALLDWMKTRKVMIVVDEATSIAKYDTARSLSMRKLAALSVRRFVMTATPTTQSLLHAHGLLMFIDNNPSVPPTMTKFKQEYFFQAGTKWLPKAISQGAIQKMMQPSIMFRTRDLHDLPPVVMIHRWPALTKEQNVAFEALRDTLIYEHVDGQEVTAMNAAVKLTKLLQVACGIAHTADSVITFDPKNKLEEIVAIDSESEGKMVIFVPFTAALIRVAEFLEDHFEPGCVRIIKGGVSSKVRGEIVEEFQDPESQVRFIVANPIAASEGLTLTEADTIVWFAPTLKAVAFEQGNGRIDRPGQKRNTRIVMLSSTDMEKEWYDSLIQKRDANSTFVSIYHKVIHKDKYVD